MDEKDKEICWLRSTLVTLLTLAKAEKSPLTNEQVVTVCEYALAKIFPATGAQ